MSRICTNCEKNTPIGIKNYYGSTYCEECKSKLCEKCKRSLNVCLSCQTIHCEECDNGFAFYAWDDIDIFKCIDCRDITINELYKYIVDTYDEKLTLIEISEIIKKNI